METNKKHLIAYSILGVLLVLFFGITIHQCSNPKIEYIKPPPEIIYDSIVRDSIQIQEKTVTRYTTKDIYIFDTIIYRDTHRIYVPIIIEHKTYRDYQTTDTGHWELEINYSGYKPTLDSVWFNYSYKPKENVVINDKKVDFGQFIGVSINLGYGATINTIERNFNPGPYIGIGICYGWGFYW